MPLFGSDDEGEDDFQPWGGDGWESQNFLDSADQEMNGSYFSSMFSTETEKGEALDFIKSYRSMYGISPDKAAAMGYDALKLVATAMRRAGTAQKDALRDEIAATKGYEGATSIWQYDQNRHPHKSAVIFRLKDGSMEFHRQIQP